MLTRTENAENQEEEPIHIQGNPDQQFILCVTTAFIGNGLTSAFSSAVTQMNIDATLKGLLANSPFISSAASQIPGCYFIGKNGGIKICLFFQSAACAGLAILAGLSAATDITAINACDWRYGLMLSAGTLIGFGSGQFGLILNAQAHGDPESVSKKQAIFGSIAESANVLSNLLIFLLKDLGYTVPFAFYAGLVGVGFLGLKLLQPTPYHQLRRHYGPEKAKKLAIQHGQNGELINTNDGDKSFKEIFIQHLKAFACQQGVTLNAAFVVSLGGYLITNTFTPDILVNGFGFSQDDAIYLSVGAASAALLARSFAHKIIARLNPKNGSAVFYFGACTWSAAFAIPIAFFTIPPAATICSLIGMNIGLGASMLPPTILALEWSNPTNKNLDPFDLATMFGLLGTFGVSGAVFFGLVGGALIDALSNPNEGELGYQSIFMLLIGCLLTVGTTTLAVNHNVKRDKDSCYFGDFGLFKPCRKERRGVAHATQLREVTIDAPIGFRG